MKPGTYCAWLKMLVAWNVNSIDCRSVMLTRFSSAKSQLLIRGEYSVLRRSVAKAPAPAWMY